MWFEYLDDAKFFANLLCKGSAALLKEKLKHLFDFRPPAIKRKEFNRLRKMIYNTLIQKHGTHCQLMIKGVCLDTLDLVVDHLIPLSSNELNKRLRGLRPEKGKKVRSQSFGSNHPDNLVLACSKCNNSKKHRIIGFVLPRIE